MAAPYCGLVRVFRTLDRNLLYDGSSGALVSLGEGAYHSWKQFLAAPDAPGASEPPGLNELAAAGLFRRPQYPSGTLPVQGLHSLCLNVAHACDLACDYCFAGRGCYGSPGASIMRPQTACAAIDYLMANSPAGRSLSVDFFGGEPLLAWPAVTEAVRYGRERAAATGREIRFTLTTNGVGLDEERAAFCAGNMSTLIVSIDGRPEIHDRHRRTRTGGPSFERAFAGAKLLARALEQRAKRDGAVPGSRATSLHPDLPIDSGPLWIRGTYTQDNLDFWRDVEFLAASGFGQVSMEPVAMPPDPAHAIRAEDLGPIAESYERIAELVLDGRVRFFHFELNTESPACAPKRFTGCAAGGGYACVNPSGAVYPCHQFDGVEGYELGRLTPGRAAADGGGAASAAPPALAYTGCAALTSAHVGNKPACRDCWAQLHCGGGCHYAALKWGGDILCPYPLGCALMKERLKAALAIQALLPSRAAQAWPGASSGLR